MHIRDATISDIPHLSALFVTAFSDDPDYESAYPWRASAPDDFARLMTAEIMQMFLQGKRRFLVVETQQGQVVAWACWTRIGSSTAAERIRAENDSVLKGAADSFPWGRIPRLTCPALERTLYHVQEALHYPFVRMFSFQPLLPDEGPLVKRFWYLYERLSAQLFVGELAEHWILQKISVDPGWRRQGIATMLLKWGLDRAREEGVVVCLNATRVGLSMYLKAGFVQIAACVMEMPDITVPIMLWRPESV